MQRIHRFMALAMVVALGVMAFGEVSRAEAAKKKPEPQAVSNLQLHEVHHLLQSIKITLEKADHDYGGHRAAAVHSIGEAEHQIKLALPHHKGKGGKTGGKVKSSDELQSLSDAQLLASIAPLKGSIGILQQADHDYGGHREHAIRDIRTAIVDLEKALVYIKSKGK